MELVILSSPPAVLFASSFFFSSSFVSWETFRRWIGERKGHDGDEYKGRLWDWEAASLDWRRPSEEGGKRYDSECFLSPQMDSHVARFYFRILLSESRVSDSSRLGKAGVTPGFVVLSDSLQRQFPARWTPAGTKVSWETVPYVQLDLSVFHRIFSKGRNEIRAVFSGCCLYLKGRCYFFLRIPNLPSHLPPRPREPLTCDGRSRTAFANE